MAFSQDNRVFEVKTDLASDVLMLRGFSGTESISAPFMYQIDMTSEQSDIDTKALLRRPIELAITLEDDSKRYVHGMISRVVEHGFQNGMSFYRAEMVPQLWFLGLSRNSRIFQQQNVLEIVESVLGEGSVEFELRCNGSYPTIEYCVQYRESDLAFVQRLLEQEGIFYYFEHEAGKHTMVIADGKSVFGPMPNRSELRYRAQGNVAEDVITSFQREHSVHVGKVTLADYDPLQPLDDMSASLSGEEEQEFYDYPGAYAKLFCNDPGDVAGQADRYARLRLELEESRHHTSHGEGNCRGILVGHSFTMEEHYRDDVNQGYVVTSLSQVAYNGDFVSGGGTAGSYNCSFTVIDTKTEFRPERRTPRPVIEGTQTAVVVGPSGEEVYVDQHSRVKCQFHWDRLGKNDENSSCWIRVATMWAGKGYGSISIPRIGNEVIVDFLEGDPDQPIIVGSVYNADQIPPNELPGAGIQMGIKSRSSKGGGGYNEISVTDTKDTELITIHAQFDMDTVVENDERLTVHNNRTKTVDVNEDQSIGADQTISVGANRTEDVGANEMIEIGGNRSISVGGNETISVAGNRAKSVDKDERSTIGGARTEKVGKNESLKVEKDRETTIGKNETLKIGDDRKSSVGKSDQLDVGKKLVINAGDEITFKTGSASIVMKKNGDIVIKGKKITTKGSGDVIIKGSKVGIN